MCTLVVAANVFPGHPLVVLANRDEQLDRPSSPPTRWSAGFLAPRDEVAGGTWLGLNERGLFVAITNRFGGPRDPARTSRGALVARALTYATAREAHAAMARLDPARYNGFHLVYADGRDVLATISDGRDLSQLSLGDGVAIVTERAFGAADHGDLARVRAIRRALADASEVPFDLKRLSRVLAQHDEADPLGGTCIHLDAMGYGTRSAMVLSVDQRARARMLWAEGPPCTAPFAPVAGVPSPGKSG